MKSHLIAVSGALLVGCSIAASSVAHAGLHFVRPDCASQAKTSYGAEIPVIGKMSSSQSSLALKLLAAVADAKQPVSLAVSPSGIASVLGALDLGADPAMQAAILKSLQLDGGKGEKKHLSMEEVRRALRLLAAGPANPALNTANALFVNLSQPLKPGIAERLMAEAQMPLRSADLAAAEGIREVNAFVSKATDGRIASIVSDADKGAALVAVNAFHFLGCWQAPFDPNETRPAPFTPLSGKTVDVPTMRQADTELAHRLDGRFAAVELGYADPRYSMVLITTTDKPAKPEEFNAAGQLMAGDAFQRGRVTLALPRFKIEAGADLLPSLSQLGLGAALKSPAAFSGIADGIMLSAVQQKTFVAVDEAGTEAAAATAAVTTRSAAPQPTAITFDRPFVFALRHRPTGLLLIAGYVADLPQDK